MNRSFTLRVLPALVTLSALNGAAQAQTQLLSNLAEASAGTATFLSVNHWLAQSFSMGGSAQTFHSVELPFAGSGSLTAHLYDDNAGKPGSQLSVLGTANVSGSGIYTLSGSQALAANAKYWIVMTPSGIGPQWSYTNSVSYASAFGASLSTLNNWAFSTTGGSSWTSRNLADGPHRLAVNVTSGGASAPEPGTFVLLTLAGTVGLVRRRREQ